MRLQLDLVDKVRGMAEQRLAQYQDLMSKHYNSKVRHRNFQVGDLVLIKVMGAKKDTTQGKLGNNQEGPYRITSWHRKGTYHLETLDRQKLHHPWNTEHLKKYYQQVITRATILLISSLLLFRLSFYYYLQFLLSPRVGIFFYLLRTFFMQELFRNAMCLISTFLHYQVHKMDRFIL